MQHEESSACRAYQMMFRLKLTATIDPDGSNGARALMLVAVLAVTLNSIACTKQNDTSAAPQNNLERRASNDRNLGTSNRDIGGYSSVGVG
jgi:hypothetical protein